MTDWLPATGMQCALCGLLGLGREADITLYGAPVCWAHAGHADVIRILQTIVTGTYSPTIHQPQPPMPPVSESIPPIRFGELEESP